MKVIFLIMIGLGLLRAEYLRDDAKQVVLDTTTSLQWQDNTTPAVMDFNTSIIYCESSSLGGYPDWHLPNAVELSSLVFYTKVNPSVDQIFKNTFSSSYWSSTTYMSDTLNAWNINFYSGEKSFNNKTNTNYVRCVRAVQ